MARRGIGRAAPVVLGGLLLWLGWSAAADTATIRGTPGANVLRGTKHADTIYGGSGADRLYGLQGSDRLYGGPGKDAVYGGAGNDWIDGGPGNDHIYGGPGNDVIYGGGGIDTISCGPGHDIVHADAKDHAAADCEVVIRPKSRQVVPHEPTPLPTTTAPPTTTTTAPPPTTTTPPTTTAPTTTAPTPPSSTCGQGPNSYRYSVVNQALTSSSVSVTVTINKLPSYPATGDHGLAYVAVSYGVTSNGCLAVGWLQGGIWRGATPDDADTGSAFLYAEWQTAQGYRLIKLANVTVPSTHTFTLVDQGVANTWGIWIDGGFVASAALDQEPTTFSTAAEDFSVDGVSWPSFDWTFSNASPSFAHAPTGLLPYDSFSGSGWHSTTTG